MDNDREWYKDKQAIACIAIAAFIGLMFGILIGRSFAASSISTVSTSMKQSSALATEEASQPAPFQSINLSGTGTNADNKVDLDAGVYIVRSSQTGGDSNFIVHFINTDTTDELYVTNEIGDYNGSSAVTVTESGTYIVDVESDGQWTIEVTK